MDLITLGNLSNNTLVPTQGQMVNGVFNLSWVERYREPGEFQITGQMSSGILDVLTKGTLLTHFNTREVMIVENIGISESRRESPTIDISGRSLTSYLEQRIVGSNVTVSNQSLVPLYNLAAGPTWTQALTMLDAHTKAGSVIDANDAVPGLVNENVASGTETAPQEARVIKRDDLLSATIELLEISDLGMKVLRPTSTGTTSVTLRIHRGTDLSGSIIFSWETGDLERTEYLSTSKEDKNAAFVTGKAVYTRVVSAETLLNRRMMAVDANDIDEGDAYKTPHSAGVYSDLQTKLGVRGREAINKNNPITITSVDISSTTKHRYRYEYDIGDIVMVDGNYGASQKMRVVEYAEIQDATGERGYPTLSILTA